MGVMNVATYGFTVLAARVLGPRPYGALASLMATLLVISVLQLALQATAARRISAEPEHVQQIEKVILRVTYRAAAALGLLLLVLTPLVNQVLRLDNLLTAALVAVAAVPLTVIGGQAGILQGEKRWRPLALVYVVAGVPRLIIGGAFILVTPTETAAMLGVTVAAFAPVVVGWYALRGVRPAGAASEQHAAGQIIRETLHNSQALFAFFGLSNADVIVARNVLDSHSAGLYAGGLILTKAVLFLPQFVVVIAFPEMSSTTARRHALTRSLTVIAVLGAASTLVAWMLPRLALVFVGGDKYAEIDDRLWAFGALGTALSMLQLLVYSVLARQGLKSVYLVWTALVVLVGIGYTVDSVSGLLATVLTVDFTLFALLFAISLARSREPDDLVPDDPAQ
jgi:O-antigen/teichoic acid export membrane protein